MVEAVVEAVMEQGGTGWRAVLGERTGVVQALTGVDDPPSLDFPHQTPKAKLSRHRIHG